MRCSDDEGDRHCIFLRGFKRQPITKLNLITKSLGLTFDDTLKGAANQGYLTSVREAMRVPTKAAMCFDSSIGKIAAAGERAASTGSRTQRRNDDWP